VLYRTGVRLAAHGTEQLVDNGVPHTQSRQPGRERVATLVNGESRNSRQFQRIMPSSFNAVDMCTRVLWFFASRIPVLGMCRFLIQVAPEFWSLV
jgi:hypothetical protein